MEERVEKGVVPTDDSGYCAVLSVLVYGCRQVMGTQAICPEPDSKGRGKELTLVIYHVLYMCIRIMMMMMITIRANLLNAC